jgi:hypothetical protein
MKRVADPRKSDVALTAHKTQVEEAWVKEAERRFSAWRRGERTGVPVERVFDQLRKDLVYGIIPSNLKSG